jgi:hypothetical protein
MMKVPQSLVPQLANVLDLRPFCLFAQSSTLLYLYLIEIIHRNPYLLYLTHGYVSKELLSFLEDHIIASILKHGNGYHVLLQPGHTHNILQG